MCVPCPVRPLERSRRRPALLLPSQAPKADIANIDKKKYLVPGDLTGASLSGGPWCARAVLSSHPAVAQFTYVIRKRIKLSAEQACARPTWVRGRSWTPLTPRARWQALWVFVESSENGKPSQILPPTSNTMAMIYANYKDEDGFLYITCAAPPRVERNFPISRSPCLSNVPGFSSASWRISLLDRREGASPKTDWSDELESV